MAPGPPAPPLGTVSAFEPKIKGGPLKIVLKLSAKTLMALMVVMIIMLLLFLGIAWDPPSHYDTIRIAVVNYDSGMVGTAWQGMISSNLAGITPRLHWVALGAATRSYDQLIKDVNHGTYHAAFAVKAGSTDALRGALGNNLLATPTLDFVFDEGRVGAQMSGLLRSAANAAAGQLSARIAVTLAGGYKAAVIADGASGSVLSVPFSSAVATTLGHPLSVNEINLHPVTYNGAATAAGLAWIIMYVILIPGTGIILGIYGPLEAAKVRPDHILALRLVHMPVMTLALSFWPPVLVRGLGKHMTGAVFFQMWAYTWLAMTVFFLCAFTIISSLGPQLGNLANMVFLIINLTSSSGVAPIEYGNRFFRIGKGLPMYQGATGVRTILFGSYNRLGRNIGVLFAWFGFTLLIQGLRFMKMKRAVEAAKAGTGPSGGKPSSGPSSEAEGQARDQGSPEEGQGAAVVIPVGKREAAGV